MISAWDCHLTHNNDIGLLSTLAMNCQHWSLFCRKVLSINFRTNFPSTFCKRTSFQSAFFNEDEFSLGPVFLIPHNCINVIIVLYTITLPICGYRGPWWPTLSLNIIIWVNKVPPTPQYALNLASLYWQRNIRRQPFHFRLLRNMALQPFIFFDGEKYWLRYSGLVIWCENILPDVES